MSTVDLKRRLAKVEQGRAPASGMMETVIRTRNEDDRRAQLAALSQAGRYTPGDPVLEIRRVIVGADGRPIHEHN